MVIGTPLGISPPRYGGDGPRGGGGGYGRPRTPDRYNSTNSFYMCVLQRDAEGTETNIGRSHGIGADLPVAAVVEVVTTWGSGVPRTGVDLAMVTETISGDHPGDLPGGKYSH